MNAQQIFMDEIEKLGIRIGAKILKKQFPTMKTTRKGVASVLNWLRRRGPTGRAVAKVSDDPSLPALAAGGAAYLGMGFGPGLAIPMSGTATGAGVMTIAQLPRLFRERAIYAGRAVAGH
jgi:hypothetical protein